MPEHKWSHKRYTLVVRLVGAAFGLAAHLCLARFLPIADIGVLAIIEGVIAIFTSLFLVGIGESINRELAWETNERQRNRLIRWGLTVRMLCGIAGVLALMTFVPLAARLYEDARVPLLLLCCAPLLALELVGRINETILCGQARFGTFLSLQLFYAIGRSTLVIALTVTHGIWGYFAGVAIARTINLSCSTWALRRDLFKSTWSPSELLTDRQLLRRNQDVALLAYGNNISNVVWQRLPLTIGGIFLPAEILGAIAIAQNLSQRLGIVSNALTAFQVPRLTRDLVHGVATFQRRARRELTSVLVANALAAVAFCVAWQNLGDLAVGIDKWNSIGILFHVFVGIQFLAGVNTAAKRCMIVPTKQTKRLLPPLIVMRSLAAGAFVALGFWGRLNVWTIPFVMTLVAILTTAVYAAKITIIWNRLKYEQTHADDSDEIKVATHAA